MPIRKNRSDHFMHQPRSAVSVTSLLCIPLLLCRHLLCPSRASSLSSPHSLCFVTLPHWERDEAGGRYQSNRWSRGGAREADAINHEGMPAWTLKWLILDRCVMNVNWLTLGVRHALPSLSPGLVTQRTGGQVCELSVRLQRLWLVLWFLCLYKVDTIQYMYFLLIVTQLHHKRIIARITNLHTFV